jgi:indole-3-glycerol phosphate synthase
MSQEKPGRTGLAEIVAHKAAEVAGRRRAVPLSEIERLAAAAPALRSLFRSLHRKPGDPIRAIAEVKRASPSRGAIRADADAARIARAYEEAGASAVSVLTESRWFLGTDDDLRAARAAVAVPVLRKDFVVDPYQVVEARAMGADAVLILVALHPTAPSLRELLDLAARVGIETLVEAHDEAELAVALDAGATIVGINNRDLATFAVDPDRALRLVGTLPSGVVRVAESGISSREAVSALEAAGADAILVGEALMASGDPGAALRRLLGRGDQGRATTSR